MWLMQKKMCIMPRGHTMVLLMYFPNTKEAFGLLEFALQKEIEADVIGVTSGCFDILHPLHVQYLEKCKAECEVLIVGVDTDRLIHQYKGKLPVFSEHDRAYMVSALHTVNLAFVMDDVKQLRDILLDITMYPRRRDGLIVRLFKGRSEYYGNPVECPKGVELVYVPDVYPINSTTELVRFIQNDYQKL